VEVYPNPAKSSFTIKTDLKLKNGSIEIFDILGKCVYTERAGNGAGFTKEITLQNASGIYFIKINAEEKVIIKKISIEP
jgi:hypothetical protein